MKTFTDNTGRVWTIAINVDAVKRVKALFQQMGRSPECEGS